MIARALSAGLVSLRTRVVMCWLWWRHAYTFNLAHKPLCERFSGNVLRFGSVRVCRSCTLLYASAAMTGIGLLCVDLSQSLFLPIFYGLFIAVMLLAYPPLYEHFPRAAKDSVRCATGCVIVMMIAFFVMGPIWLGVPNVALFATAYRMHLNEYKKWKRRTCDGCSELGQGGMCSGFREQAVRIRAFEAAAEEYLGYSRCEGCAKS